MGPYLFAIFVMCSPQLQVCAPVRAMYERFESTIECEQHVKRHMLLINHGVEGYVLLGICAWRETKATLPPIPHRKPLY